MQVTLYADVLFAVNFCMDFFLLWLVGKLAQQRTTKRRLLGGSLVAAGLYCLILFAPPLRRFYNLFGSLLILTAAIWVTFRPNRLKIWLKLLFFIHLAAFALGGAASALYYQLAGGKFSVGLLFVTTLGAYLTLKLGGRLLNTYVLNRRKYCRLSISLGGVTEEVTVLLDTGNHLKNPLTGKAVAVVHFLAIQAFFPPAARLLFLEGNGGRVERVIEALKGSPMEKRIRVIPFCSLGTQNGILLGFQGDKIEVSLPDGRQAPLENVEIGIALAPLSADYDGLLDPEVLKECGFE